METVLIVVDAAFNFIDRAVAGGYVVALALVCLLQYAVHLHRLAQFRSFRTAYQNELDDLEGELQQVQKDRSLSHLENVILREFVAETQIDQALNLLLRRFAPDPQSDFAAFVEREGVKIQVQQSRGLSKIACERLQIDEEILRQLSETEWVVLDGSALRNSRFFDSLPATEQKKVRQLFLITVTDHVDELQHIFVATSLYPRRAPRQQQLELANRLMHSVARNLRQNHTLRMREHQLRSTNEMLELRSITDRHFDSPLLMIEEFVDRLRDKIDADRAVLFLCTPDEEVPYRTLTHCGIPLQRNIQNAWQQLENRLVEAALARGCVELFDEIALKQIGIDRLFRQALVCPLAQNGTVIGVACFTKRQSSALSHTQRTLASWAAEYLSETILRVLTHAAVERQALQDGLTELANRRAFDLQIVEEVDLADQAGNECSLILLDIDHFKSFNDTYGHQAGDEVLRMVARAVEESVLQIRAGDRALAARYGGEEIAVLLPEMGTLGASRIAEMIREAVEQMKVSFQHHELQVTISVGTATFPHHGRTVEQLIAATDAALYRAKQAGRNCICHGDSGPTLRTQVLN